MDSLLTVSIANNDETIKYNPDISYRLVGLVPNFNRAAAEDMSQSDATFRRKEITHSCMKVLLERLKPILDTKSTFLFADGKYRVTMPFLHFLNLDGKEIADHVLGSCTQCHLCDVKRKDLDRTDLPFSHSEVPSRYQYSIDRSYWNLFHNTKYYIFAFFICEVNAKNIFALFLICDVNANNVQQCSTC